MSTRSTSLPLVKWIYEESPELRKIREIVEKVAEDIYNRYFKPYNSLTEIANAVRGFLAEVAKTVERELSCLMYRVASEFVDGKKNVKLAIFAYPDSEPVETLYGVAIVAYPLVILPADSPEKRSIVFLYYTKSHMLKLEPPAKLQVVEELLSDLAILL